jgi:hypothetical protein
MAAKPSCVSLNGGTAKTDRKVGTWRRNIKADRWLQPRVAPAAPLRLPQSQPADEQPGNSAANCASLVAKSRPGQGAGKKRQQGKNIGVQCAAANRSVDNADAHALAHRTMLSIRYPKGPGRAAE